MEFSINSTLDENNKVWNVAVCGEIDIFNSELFKESLLKLLEEKQYSINIECSNLDYLDSTALSALVVVLKKAKLHENEICIQSLKPSLLKLFKITNLDKIFIIER